jgi:NTP pyrophosphatase (non-canonical NTP hydrolase)
MLYTLKKLQEMVGEQVKDRGGYWSYERILLHAHREVSELAETMSFKSGELRPKPGQPVSEMEHEAADVLYALICFANKAEIDLTKALIEKLAINQVRDDGRFDPIPTQSPEELAEIERKKFLPGSTECPLCHGTDIEELNDHGILQMRCNGGGCHFKGEKMPTEFL